MVDTDQYLGVSIMPDDLIGQGDITKGYYSKTERISQIMRYLSDGKIRSTSEIAAALKMKPTTKFRAILLTLYRNGHLLAYQESRMYRWQSRKFYQIRLFDQLESEIG